MTPYEAFVAHWSPCDRCWRWHCAIAGSTLCSTGEKLYRQLTKGP